jgi:general secretion pathway protein C
VGLSELTGKLVEPARWIVIGGIAFTLANTVLFFIAPPTPGAGSLDVRQPVRSQEARPAVSIQAILNRNLFGEAGESAVVDTGLPAVETRLPLELLGVFVADLPEDSAAIIAQKGKAGLLYVVGEKVPGNAELIEVHADHIVLRRAGSREILNFPQMASSRMTTEPEIFEPEPEPSMDTTDIFAENAYEDEPETPRDFVASYRDRIDADPEGTLREIGITPVSEGDAQGYRLDSAAASSPYLSQTGLQPGDVVLSVNGQPVGNIQQDRHQIDNILAEGSARIEVQRGSRRFFVTASLKQ